MYDGERTREVTVNKTITTSYKRNVTIKSVVERLNDSVIETSKEESGYSGYGIQLPSQQSTWLKECRKQAISNQSYLHSDDILVRVDITCRSIELSKIIFKPRQDQKAINQAIGT
ncbi:hypothetical protein JTB14_025984 [Gonioctena quinquepunctata]|nr:hypothetical protein JTB14_025984 [Gonioctena quinquepunctata]